MKGIIQVGRSSGSLGKSHGLFRVFSVSAVLFLIATLSFSVLVFPKNARADATGLLQLTQTIYANEYIDMQGDEFSYTFTPVLDYDELVALEDKVDVQTNIIVGDRIPSLSPLSITAQAMESQHTSQSKTIDVPIPEYEWNQQNSGYIVYKVNAVMNFHDGHSEYISDASYYLLIDMMTWSLYGADALTPDDIMIVQIKDDMDNDVDFVVKDKLDFSHWYLDTVATQIDFATENTSLGEDSVVPMLLVVTPPDNYMSVDPNFQYEKAIHASAAYGVGSRVIGTGNLVIGEEAAAQGYYNTSYGTRTQVSGSHNSAIGNGSVAGGYANNADNGGLTVDYSVAVPSSSIAYNGVWNYPSNQATGTLCSQSEAAQSIGLTGTPDNAWCVLYYARNGEGGGPVFTDIPVGAKYDVFPYWGSFDYESRDTVFAPSPPSLNDFPEEIWLATYSNPNDTDSVIDHWDAAGWDGSALRGFFSNTSTPIYIRDYMEYFSLYFDGNGADSGATAAIANKPAGTQVTFTPNGFVREGYTFKGWASSAERANAGEVDYADEADFTFPNHDTTVYAVWDLATPPFNPPATALKTQSQSFPTLLFTGASLGALLGMSITYVRKRYVRKRATRLV